MEEVDLYVARLIVSSTFYISFEQCDAALPLPTNHSSHHQCFGEFSRSAILKVFLIRYR